MLYDGLGLTWAGNDDLLFDDNSVPEHWLEKRGSTPIGCSLFDRGSRPKLNLVPSESLK